MLQLFHKEFTITLSITKLVQLVKFDNWIVYQFIIKLINYLETYAFKITCAYLWYLFVHGLTLQHLLQIYDFFKQGLCTLPNYHTGHSLHHHSFIWIQFKYFENG